MLRNSSVLSVGDLSLVFDGQMSSIEVEEYEVPELRGAARDVGRQM